MKAYVVADPKIAKTVYSIFDKKELAKYIEFFVKKYTQANYLYLIKISQCPSKAMTHLYIVRAPSLGKTEA